jgi:spore coat protein U-like protein
MKKLIVAALGATTFIAAPAFAQPVNINLEGTVALSCNVIANPSIVNPEAIDLANTATDQSLGSLTYQCNNAAGFTRTVSSLNGGLLKRAGGAAGENTIAYEVGHGGGPINFANTSLAQPKITNHGGSTAFVQGQTGSIRVRVGQASGPLFAGTYGDTITVTIAPN